MSEELFLAAAVEAAKNAGEIIRKGFYQTKNVEHKGQVDLVTETDKAVPSSPVPLARAHWPPPPHACCAPPPLTCALRTAAAPRLPQAAARLHGDELRPATYRSSPQVAAWLARRLAAPDRTLARRQAASPRRTAQ